MKHLVKIAGLCLASVLLMGMALSTTASAAKPVWEQCFTEKEGATVTKYTEHQCVKATPATGVNWSWQEVKGTEKVISHGTLRLADTEASILGETAVQCAGTDAGVVGPGKLDKTTEITTTGCEIVVAGGCESLIGNAVARDLPWQTELFETEKKQFDKITEDGKGQPGWETDCNTALGEVKDTCLSVPGKEETTEMINEATGGSLLVRSVFLGTHRAKCSASGRESGVVKGSIAILAENGWGLRVS